MSKLASDAANEIATNVHEISKVSIEIFSNIQGVTDATRNTASGVTGTNLKAEELSKLSGRLLEIVKQFKI